MKNIDVALVYDLWGEYAAAANAGDLERWMSLWIDDGIQMAPDAPLRIGRRQIREAMRVVFEVYDTRNMTIHTEEVRVLGDWAYSYGTFAFERTLRSGGKITNYYGKFLDIVVKGAAGSWRIAVDCHNYDKPQNKNGTADQEGLGERR